jgi:carbon starvation protein CstA
MAKTVETNHDTDIDPIGQQDIIHTLRTAQQHQVTLSMIADQKANIIIGFALIFFSVIQSQMFSEEFINDRYFFPLSALALTVFISFFLAILVVLPRFKRGHAYTQPSQMPNPLFFGFFASFTQKEYTDYMMDTVDSNEAARRLMVQDLYQIGVVLKKKYELLRFSYLSLAIGALLSIIILVVKLILN